MKRFTSIILAIVVVSGLSTATLAVSADTENPSDVENVEGAALNGAVRLSWSPSTDDTGVEGYQVHYGTESVNRQGQSYEKSTDVGDITQTTISGLENGTKYYFSVVAYDEAGNESLSWAPEISVTPLVDANAFEDEEAPQVSDAEALNKVEVKVEFSEEVVIPDEDEDPQDAFTIENNDTFEPLVVTEAKMDEEDETNKTVILTTAEQEEGAEYKLTVGIDIKDKAGNPVISGTSDTAIFTGSGAEKQPDDAEAPKIVKIESVDTTHILINFDETIVLGIDPADNFKIVSEEEPTKELTVLGVELGTNSDGVEDASAIITTEKQENIRYSVAVSGLKDEDGNEMTEEQTIVVRGKASEEPTEGEPEPEDTIAPEDVADFIAKAMVEAQKYAVTLTWKIPANSDAVKQTLYMSEDNEENYQKKTDLEADVAEYEVEGLEPGEYWFKLTQTDQAGNESEGTSVKVVLSETGPGVVGLILASIGLGRLVTRKKRQ